MSDGEVLKHHFESFSNVFRIGLIFSIRMGGCISIVFEDARDQAEKGPTFKIEPTTQDWDQSQNKNKVNRLSKQSNRQSVKTNRSHRHSKQSLVVPCQSHDQISVGRYSQISVK